jgi:hypothetical protein
LLGVHGSVPWRWSERKKARPAEAAGLSQIGQLIFNCDVLSFRSAHRQFAGSDQRADQPGRQHHVTAAGRKPAGKLAKLVNRPRVLPLSMATVSAWLKLRASARITFAASSMSPCCSGRSSSNFVKPRDNSLSASDWTSRIVIVFVSAVGLDIGQELLQMRLEVKIGIDRPDTSQIVEAPDDAGCAVIDAAMSSLVIERVPGPKRIRPKMSEGIGSNFGNRLFYGIRIPRYIVQRDMTGMVDHKVL